MQYPNDPQGADVDALSPMSGFPGAPTHVQLPSSESGRLLPPRTESGRLLRWDDAPQGWSPSPYLTEFDDVGFERQVISSRIPVIVDFWADRCAPCKRQVPVLEEVGRLLIGRVKVGRINVYRNPEVTRRYGVKGVPHLMVVKEGQVVLELVGDHEFEQLWKHLEQTL